MAADDVLAATLSQEVALRIAALRTGGGPTEGDWTFALGFLSRLGSDGASLVYWDMSCSGGAGGTDIVSLFLGLTHALAVLAFVPGGIHFCGLYFTAGEEAASEAPQSLSAGRISTCELASLN